MEYPSPFLPGTKLQFAWDSTSLSWLKTCPRLYEYSMIEGWRSQGESVHLRFGIEIHSALEHYDKARADGQDHNDALTDTVLMTMKATWEYTPLNPNAPESPLVGRPWRPDHNAKTRENLIRSIIWYLDNFADDPAQTLILANGKPAVELSFRMEMEWGPSVPEAQDEEPNKDGTFNNQPYLLCGHLDRVVTFLDQNYVMDRKTTSSIPYPSWFEQFHPHNQMSIYTLAGKIQFGIPVSGVIIDAIQLAVGFTRFQRGFTYRTEGELNEWLKDFKVLTRQAEAYAAEGYWPKNDTACDKYGGCTFRKVCSKSPEVRKVFLESDFVRKPWNPLEPR